MSTQAQIAANRLNALKSTGPITLEGKSRSRLNAITHGISAESEILPGENAADLDALTQGYMRECRPVGNIETQLVTTLVRADWHMRRYERIEAQVVALLVDPSQPAATAIAQVYAAPAGPNNPLPFLFRRRTAAQRDWFRALKELKERQESRVESGTLESCEPEAAAEANIDLLIQLAAEYDQTNPIPIPEPDPNRANDPSVQVPDLKSMLK